MDHDRYIIQKRKYAEKNDEVYMGDRRGKWQRRGKRLLERRIRAINKRAQGE